MLVDFEILKGKILTKIENSEDEIFFYTNSEIYKLWHKQECCERVYIYEIDGDLKDLIGSPILRAEEVFNDSSTIPIPNLKFKYSGGSTTWTFYKLAAIKGSVTIRCFGESNGYYSETMDFEKIGDIDD